MELSRFICTRLEFKEVRQNETRTQKRILYVLD